MSDRAAVVVALAVAVGAWWAAPVPRPIGVVAVAAALVARRPALLAVGGLLLAAGLAHAAWAGLEPPPPASVTARAVTLVTDPEVDGGEVTAVI
ncbi:MAG: hypothetical protein ABWZ68_03460, partial [Acidimicrobiales bacterium]